MRVFARPFLWVWFTVAGCFPAPVVQEDTTQTDTSSADTQQPDTVAQPDTAQPDTAQPDTAQPDTAQNCPDGCAHLAGVCVVGACVGGSCEPTPKTGPCDDGDACTQVDACQGGVCTGSDPVICDAESQCHEAGTCDPATGLCSAPEKPWDAACDSGTEYPGFCRAGVCKGRMVSIGGEATCLAVHGIARCWYQTNQPAKDQSMFAFDSDVIDIFSSETGYCARLADKTVRCWSDNNSAASATVFPLPVEKLAVAVDNRCVVTADTHEVRCWGSAGLLAPGAMDYVDMDHALDIAPVPIPNPVMDISAGAWHACALDVEGKVWCWGRGTSGALGYGSTADRGQSASDFASPVPLGVLATSLTVGSEWTCALTPSGAMRCWGALLSHGTATVYGDTEAAYVGGNVQLGGTVMRLAPGSTGNKHTCVLMAGGAVRCWGAGGPMGYENTDAIGDDEQPNAVGLVNLGENAVFVAVGGYSPQSGSCAIGESGRVFCWGVAQYLGYGDGSDRGGTPGSMPPGPVPFE